MANGLVVAIDVLRASTTITQALVAGAAAVLPCLEVADAHALAAPLTRESYLLGGERGGLPIDGFDLGNSPCDYTPARVAERTLIFTTTNGTRAIAAAHLAHATLIGAFTNAAAITRYLLDPALVALPIHLLCAGTRGQITREDVLLAGLLIDRLQAAASDGSLNDCARLARDAWHALLYESGGTITPGQLAATLRDTQGGRNLISIGLDRDLIDVAQLDSLSAVPVVRWDADRRAAIML
jgi:2-phosphosulfolactate phosphatase